MREKTDEELMRMIALGVKPAFDELFRRHASRVLGYCARMVGDRATGEDISQDVWIRVVNSAPDWKPQGELRSWILTIARNRALNHLRARKRMHAADEAGVEAGADVTRESVEDLLMRAQDRRALAEAFDGLTDLKRSALTMWLSENLSYEEIARELSVSVSSIKSLLFRARKDLEEEIRRRNGGFL